MTKDRQKLMNRKVYFWETASPLGKNDEYAEFLQGVLLPNCSKPGSGKLCLSSLSNKTNENLKGKFGK